MRAVRLRSALSAAGALTLLLAGCAGEDSPGPTDEAAADAEAMSHVHGLGIDPGSGTLFAATHFGVFRVGSGGSLTRIADRWQDTMAFTVIGPGRFLGSGHPDPREDLPPQLGLIESVDAGKSWSVLSLGGEADFHALDVAGDRIYGYDATSGQIMTTTDRRTWTTLARAAVVDVVADPADSERVLASSPDGSLGFYSAGPSGSTPVDDPPPVVLLEWPLADSLVGVTADGHVYRSEDAGAGWTRLPDLPGPPQAFDATKRVWHVATDQGIYGSRDAGATWQAVVEVQP